MRMSFAAGRERGFTLIELFVVLAVITVLASIFIPAAIKHKERALRIQCVSNLIQTGLAFRIWEGDHGNSYPMAVSETNGGTTQFVTGMDEFRHFQVVSNELATPKVLFCPADSERIQPTKFGLKPIPGEIPFTSNSNLSYFLGLDANESNPQLFLSGDRNITNGTPLKNGVLELATNHSASWTSEMHHQVGNILLADGSVQQESTLGLNSAFASTPAFTNRLLMPVLGN